MKNNNSTRSGKKKILLISYHFPPSTAVGGLRIANFAKYLPLFGWNTSVLTIKDRYLDNMDTKRINDDGDVRVIKTGKLPKFIQAYLMLKTMYHSLKKRRFITLNELERSHVQPNGYLSGSENIPRKIKRYLVSFLTLPDGERNWILPAVFRAVREIKGEKIDCILTSSPPYSVQIIGLLVKLVTGVKWIADFRDPWITVGPKRLYETCALSTRIEGWLEKEVVKRADLVLTTTRVLGDTFRKSYNKQSLNKFIHVTNGFDTEFFNSFKHLKKYDKFTLTYAGTLYLGRSPEPVFKALNELVIEGQISLNDIRVKLVGNCQSINGHSITQLIQSYGLGSVVEVSDPVPYHKALEIIRCSHVALLFAPDQPFQIPAKVYDYIGMETKILALTEEGATRELIDSTGSGAALYPSDIRGIKEFIYRSIMNNESLIQTNNSHIMQKFDRRLITRDLAGCLNQVMGDGNFKNKVFQETATKDQAEKYPE